MLLSAALKTKYGKLNFAQWFVFVTTQTVAIYFALKSNLTHKPERLILNTIIELYLQ